MLWHAIVRNLNMIIFLLIFYCVVSELHFFFIFDLGLQWQKNKYNSFRKIREKIAWNNSKRNIKSRFYIFEEVNAESYRFMCKTCESSKTKDLVKCCLELMRKCQNSLWKKSCTSPERTLSEAEEITPKPAAAVCKCSQRR